MDGTDALNITVVGDLANIDRAVWDGLANPADAPYDPFLSWDFLQALEESGCASAPRGWQPAHLLARDAAGAPVGAMLLYAKDHSYGEYVFDHGWADALQRAGERYYPKLQCAVPFTPVPGRRIFARDPAVELALAQGAVGLAQRGGASSVHATFATAEAAARLKPLGYMTRVGLQYHWFNRGYASFEDFLADLSSQKRKTIRRERARACEGLTIRRLRGAEIKETDWDFFFRCYMDTGSRKWGSPYLNRAFFTLLGERMADQCVLFVAKADGAPIASALNLVGGDALYGRYWGRVADVPFLHFELCYYQAIELAIELGLPRVEAGAQGEHKLARGYVPAPTYSAHWIAHPGLRTAVQRYLDAETPAVTDEAELLMEHTPFKKGE
ncbi:GNAT family N-acetyltransferase [Terricaulis sp.]|uniref:GNAT family N-acetyltransferase n=1 Tax=Terricaulis sp. TaxID=2768686 RepID=UPI002AC54C76|nr:GNAT family N-acetyltransferase [Terricaulis sp.]MDZ4691578.1 GNAT family N-acetyltransferase [Terricaulis sp.]